LPLVEYVLGLQLEHERFPPARIGTRQDSCKGENKD